MAGNEDTIPETDELSQQSGDPFKDAIAAAMKSQAPQEPEEVIVMPHVDIPAADYIAKLLFMPFFHPGYEGQKQFDLASRFQDLFEKNAAHVKTLRALLCIDSRDDHHNVGDKIDDIQVRQEFDLAFFTEACDCLYSQSTRFYAQDLFEGLLDVAFEHVPRLNARAMRREEKEHYPLHRDSSYVVVAYGYQDSLDEALLQMQHERLRIPDIPVMPSIKDVAELALNFYPVMRDRKSREQCTSRQEMSYLITADFIAHNLYNDEISQMAAKVMEGEAPPKLKVLGIMNMMLMDNMIQLGDLISGATETGYRRE